MKPRAEQLLRKADLRLPNHQSVWANLGHAFALQGEHAEADKALWRAIQLDPDSDVAREINDFKPPSPKEGHPLSDECWPCGLQNQPNT